MDKNNIEIKSLIQIFVILTLTYLLISLLFGSMDSRPRMYGGAGCPRRECELCEPYMLNNNIEEFENAVNTYEATSKYTSEYSSTNVYKYYQSAALNAPSLEGEAPSNLMFGEIQKYNINKDGKNSVRIHVFANLYVIDGNVYNENNSKVLRQSYNVYLYDSKNNKNSRSLGELKRNGDGLYKFDLTSDDISLNAYDSIIITHKKNDAETVILKGQF